MLSVMPLPALVLAMAIEPLRIGLGLEFLRYLASALLLISGTCYLASLALAIVCGFLSKNRPLLFPPTTSLLVIALFVILLPENVREDPWRVTDVLIFVSLIVLNVMQILSLRKRSLSPAGRGIV